MSKKPPAGKCVYCLQNHKEMNWDHVFPESWYPDSTPKNLEKWKIPSCIKCNSDYGKMEREMLHQLGLSVGLENLAAIGIPDRVHRALNGKFGKTKRDIIAREKERAKILCKLAEVTPELEKGVYPILNPIKFKDGEKKMGLWIEHDWFQRLAVKIVRGITYVEYKAFIEEPYEITFGVLREVSDNPILRVVTLLGYTHFRGPGLIVKMARAAEDVLSSVWVIEIWQHIRMYAFCLDKTKR